MVDRVLSDKAMDLMTQGWAQRVEGQMLGALEASEQEEIRRSTADGDLPGGLALSAQGPGDQQDTNVKTASDAVQAEGKQVKEQADSQGEVARHFEGPETTQTKSPHLFGEPVGTNLPRGAAGDKGCGSGARRRRSEGARSLLGPGNTGAAGVAS